MPRRLSRREFLETGTTLGVAGLFCGFDTTITRLDSPNDRLHVGVIAVAGQGAYDLREVANAGAAIVALCDVDEERAATARDQFPRAKFYTDFRRLIDQK